MNRAFSAGPLSFAVLLCLAGCSAADKPTPAEPVKVTCSSTETKCGDWCADVKTDPRHCGQCGHACASGTVCAAGACVLQCPSGQQECAGGCFDVSGSRQHCGTCGHACGAGEVCAAGECQLVCPEGQSECDGACFDLMATAQHCGTCEIACGAGELCADGDCRLECPAGQAECSGACFVLSSSRAHCGTCEVACGAGQVCVSGQCLLSCPAGQTECTGRCFDLNTTDSHCGNCETACTDGQACLGGECRTSCPTGQEVCNGACVILATSREHCGRCDNPCLAGQICAVGQCEVSCGGAQVLCGATCTDTRTSRANCGACGHACGIDETCEAGVCRLVCATGTTACGTECRDTRNDRAHCGACGHACSADKVCVNGQCELNCRGFTPDVCDGACTNTQVNPLHCGTCATACTGNTVCTAGVCASPSTCPTPNVVCGSSCTSTVRDPANCGSCGNACVALANATAVCALGACGNACASTYADCDGDLLTSGSDGCEINLSTSIAHCGECRHACPTYANALSTCVARTCAMGACVTGFTDCDGQSNNGCEANVASDVNNCGSCGHVCTPGAACIVGVCVSGAEDCTTALSLVNGQNSISWAAARQDYWTAAPATTCPGASTAYAPSGPDIVLRYTSNFTGFVQFKVEKPVANRWHMVTSANCGVISPNGVPFQFPVLNCISENALPYLDTGFIQVTPTSDLFLHVVSTTNGGAPLTNPMSVTVTPVNCATDAATVSLSPINGTFAPTVRPRLVISASRSLSPAAGSITLTGSLTPAVTFPVTQTANVVFSNNNKTITINPGFDFQDRETVTVTWTGMQDSMCSLPLPQSTWSFAIAGPATSGRVAGTMTTINPTGVPTTLYSYGGAYADSNPNGYVYLGSYGSSTTTTYDIWRVKKDGTAMENVRQLFDATSAGATKEGYGGLVIDGQNIYSIDNTNGTSGVLWRISTDGGATFVAQDMATFSPAMNYSSYGGAAYGGKIYILSRPTSTTAMAEIWSVDPSTWTPTTPAAAVKLTTLPAAYSYYACGLGVDATNYYVVGTKGGSSSNWVLLRVNRTTGDIVELTATDSTQSPSWFPGNSTYTKAVLISDRDGDGVADFLYVRGGYSEAYYVSAPASAAPYIDRLVTWAGNTSSYNGLGYDPVANVLWAWDGGSSPKKLVKIQ